MPTKRLRSSSLLKRLMFQAIDCFELGDWSSGGPNIIRAQGVPAVDRVLGHLLLLGRALHESEQDLEALALVERLFLADADHGAAVGAEGARHSGTWLQIAAPSTIQPMAPMSA